MTTKEIKRMFREWATRNDLVPIRSHYDSQPGTALMIRRRGLFSVEVGTIPSSAAMLRAGMSTGYQYPVRDATEEAATSFFANN